MQNESNYNWLLVSSLFFFFKVISVVSNSILIVNIGLLEIKQNILRCHFCAFLLSFFITISQHLNDKTMDFTEKVTNFCNESNCEIQPLFIVIAVKRFQPWSDTGTRND